MSVDMARNRPDVSTPAAPGKPVATSRTAEIRAGLERGERPWTIDARHLLAELDKASWEREQYKLAAEGMTAERDALAAQVQAVRELATEWETHPDLDGHPIAQEVIDGLVAQLRAALGEG